MKKTLLLFAAIIFSLTAVAQITVSQKWETVAKVEKKYKVRSLKNSLTLKLAITAQGDSSYFLETYSNRNYPHGPSYTNRIELGAPRQAKALLLSIVNYNGPTNTEVDLNNPSNNKGYFYNDNEVITIDKDKHEDSWNYVIFIDSLRELIEQSGI